MHEKKFVVACGLGLTIYVIEIEKIKLSPDEAHEYRVCIDSESQGQIKFHYGKSGKSRKLNAIALSRCRHRIRNGSFVALPPVFMFNFCK